MDKPDLLELLVELCENIAKKDVEMLRVLYRDFPVSITQLEGAGSAFDIFRLLEAPGLLTPTNINILIQTIEITGLAHLKMIIERYATYPVTVEIDMFSKFRQDVIDLGKGLSVEEIQKICQIYGCSFRLPWKLIQHLENSSVLTKETLPSFLDTLKSSQATKDFNKLLSDLSEAIENKSKEYVSMLKVLCADHVNVQADLWKAKTAFDVFKLLEEAGYLKTTDISILHEMIVVTGLDYLKEIIERYMQPYPDQVSVIHFSAHRHNIMHLGKSLSNKRLRRICCKYEVPSNHRSRWKMIKYLQENDRLSEENISMFLDKLKQNEESESVTLVKFRRNQDQTIRDYLSSWMRRLYKDENKMTPAIWHEGHTVDVTSLFTDLNLRQVDGDMVKSISIQEEGRPTILKEVLGFMKSTEACKLLITGKGGMGKTTLLKYIAHNWATGVDDTFSDKLIFLINVRDLHARKTIVDAAVKTIMPETFRQNTKIQEDPVKVLETFITDHDNELVLLLDGLDELEEGATSPIFLFKNLELRKSSVILTSRPGNTAKFEQCCKAHIEVKGFNAASIHEFIGKYYKSCNKVDLGQQLVRKFNLDSICTHMRGGSNKEAFELCSSPFLLLKICTIWEEKRQLPTDLSDLFKDLICCILNQYRNKSGSEASECIDEFDRIPENQRVAILALGKYTYEGLKTNKLTIDRFLLKEMVKDDELVKLALEPGFVYKENPVAHDDLKQIYTPPHKLISEAVAGFYLSVQIDNDTLDADEFQILRSNEYLHMTRIFAIEFLGVNAGELLKHWLTNEASNYFSLAQYFRYVKEKYKKDVLNNLDKVMSPPMRRKCSEMRETFRMVLCFQNEDGQQNLGKHEHLLQMMSDCFVKYESKREKLVQLMLSQKSTETIDVLTSLVHILIMIDGLYGSHFCIHKSYFEYLAQLTDDDINVLTEKMEEIKFTYSSDKFSFDKFKAPNQKKLLSSKFVSHVLNTSSNLRFLTLNCVKGCTLNAVFSDLNNDKESFFKLEYICFRNNDLSDFDGLSLVILFQTTPKLRELDMSDCNLSGGIVNTVVNELESRQIKLFLPSLIVSHNYFEDTDGASFATLIRFAPELKYLDIGSCSLTTKFLSNLLDECDRNGVLLSDHLLNLTGNKFVDINGASLVKLVKLSGQSFKWNDYSLSVANFESLLSYVCEIDCRVTLPWTKLNISGLDLSSIIAEALACLFERSPNLCKLSMDNCNLSGSVMSDVLDNCEANGVVLKENILSLKGNNLSDIDDMSLSALLNLICLSDNTRKGRRDRMDSSIDHETFLQWSDYSFSTSNLTGMINVSMLDSDDPFSWRRLDLSGNNLASITGNMFVTLLKLSPQLNYLKMNNCSLSGKCIKNILDECEKNGIKLNGNIRLSLKSNDLSDIDDVTLVEVVGFSGKSFEWSEYSLSSTNLRDFLSRVHDKLMWQNLDLSDVDLSLLEAKSLFDLFKVSPKLKVFNMNRCHLQSNVLADVFNRCQESNMILSLTDLFLKGNDFHGLDSDTFSTLTRCIPDLEKLDMSDCKLTCSIMKDLPMSSSNKIQLKSLQAINLSGNNFKELTKAVITTFSNCFPALEHLVMRSCNLPVGMVQYLPEMASKRNIPLTLTSIDIGGNDLSKVKWATFSSRISKSTQLKVVKLDSCHLPSTFLYDIERVFSRRELKLRLTDIFLHHNDLSNLKKDVVVSILSALPSLMRLYLDNCNLKSKDLLALIEAFSEIGSRRLLRVFNTLRLHKNDFSDIDGMSLALLFKSVYSLCSPYLLSFIPQLVILSSCGLNDGIIVDMVNSWQVETNAFKLTIDDNNIADKDAIKRKLKGIIAELDDF
ncbi:uncharacterized protein [Antedon mediterranea]|uniref:uncharacterized protein isoform X2 n=1 Tax=Antedon mediterranea TaxID=105859 RepID=UPI003AF74220